MAKEIPTHTVSYNRDATFTVEIRIGTKLLADFESDPATRDRARKTVCGIFSRACAMKFKRLWTRTHQFVSWKQITVTPLS